MIYNTIQAQAAILSFNDIYRILAVVMALMTPGLSAPAQRAARKRARRRALGLIIQHRAVVATAFR